MSTKVILDATAITALIERTPEIEAQLAAIAIPQVATHIMRKVEQRAPKLEAEVERAFNSYMQDRRGRYGIPGMVRDEIQTFLKEECHALALSVARQSVKDVLPGIMDDQRRAFLADMKARTETGQRRIDEYAAAAAEREVMALLRNVKLAEQA